MDEMPSGALNGFTPNQAREIQKETEELKFKRRKNYIKQQNACLSNQDSKLFYKLYFGLLDFTNKKYKINPNLKIYKALGLDLYELQEIVEQFWGNKDAIVFEFCMINPYKFSKEELSIVSEFKKGIRKIIIITKYEKDYTAVMDEDKVYMIKGLNANIDEIISYENLPLPVMTSIIPFKGVLVYDGMFMELGVRSGNEFAKLVEEDYAKAIKYYHL